MTGTSHPQSLRAPRLVMATVALCVLATSAGAFAAPGAAGVTYGWWTSAAAPAPVGVGGPVAPDAPHDSMVVQGGAPEVGEVAYGAVAFRYDSGSKPGTLRLPVVPGPGTVGGTLRACAVSGTVGAAEGAPASDGPSFDCTRSSTATLKDGAYAFDVSALSTDGQTQVALVAENPGTRVVFAKPVATALQLTVPSPDVAAQPTDGAAPPIHTRAAPVAESDVATAAAAPLDPGAVTPTDEPPLMAAAPPAPSVTAADQVAPVVEVALTRTPTGPPAQGHLGLLAGAAALLAGALWTAASRRAGLDPDPVDP